MPNFRILVLHGPNVNLFGTREPEIYGPVGYDEINSRLQSAAQELEVELRTVQSNSEGALIDTIQQARTWANAILINPGAYSHYSIAIRDALAAVKLPTIEVHLTNIHGREEFRRRLMIAPACTGVICGIGWRGYIHALQALVQILQDRAGQSAA